MSFRMKDHGPPKKEDEERNAIMRPIFDRLFLARRVGEPITTMPIGRKKSLPKMSPEQRKLYTKLRVGGLTREEALKEALS